MVMKFMRKKKNMRVILWITAALIIPGFLIWGVGMPGQKAASQYAASVNRENINLREYYHRMAVTERRYREMFGERAGDFMRYLDLERSVLDEMIRERLLLQEARRRRIRVSDRDIIDVIKAEQVFRDDEGNFDEEKFRYIIGALPPEELRQIEDEVRDNILIEKLKDYILDESNVDISDKDVRDYMEENEITGVEEESIRRRLLGQKREEVFNNWYKNLRDSANIVIYVDLEKDEEAITVPQPTMQEDFETDDQPELSEIQE